MPLPFCTRWPAFYWTWKPFRNRKALLNILSPLLFSLHILISFLRYNFCYELLEGRELSCMNFFMFSGSDLCYKWRQWRMFNIAIWHDGLLVYPLGIPYGEVSLQLPKWSNCFITPAENVYLNRKLFTKEQEGKKRKLGQVRMCVCVPGSSLRNIAGVCVVLIHLFVKFPN